MESNEQNKLTKWTQTHGYREETESCQRRRRWGLGVKGEEIKQNNNNSDTDKSMVIARRKGSVGR